MFFISQLIEEQLQCHEELYRETVEAGTQILMITDARTQTRLRTELDILKEMWEQSCGLVGKRKALANTITHVCDPILMFPRLS